MPGACGRTLISAALCIGIALTGRAVGADESCAGIPKFGLSQARFRFAVNAPAPGDLGMDFEARALTFAFADRRCRLAHAIDGFNFQAPDFGDAKRRIYHLLGYRLAFIQRDVAAYVGVRALSLISGELSLLTPTAGIGYVRERISFRLDVEVPGLHGFSLADRQRMVVGGVRIAGRAAVDLTARARLEGRARWRSFEGLALADDVTLAAGIGAAVVNRDGLRGLPAFLGLGVRTRTQRASPQTNPQTITTTQFLLFIEFDMAAIGDWPP